MLLLPRVESSTLLRGHALIEVVHKDLPVRRDSYESLGPVDEVLGGRILDGELRSHQPNSLVEVDRLLLVLDRYRAVSVAYVPGTFQPSPRGQFVLSVFHA